MAHASVRLVRLVAAGLAAGDAAFAVLLARHHRLPDDVFGESTGSWRDWGVGILVSYAGVQGAVAARPTPDRLTALALLRGVLVPGHVSRYAIERTKRPLAVGLCAMNAAVATLAWHASRRASTSPVPTSRYTNHGVAAGGTV